MLPVEVDPHDDPAERRAVDLDEAGGGEDARAADVDLVPRDPLLRLREDRVRLERAGAAAARVLDGRPGERVRDAAAAEAGSHEDARRRPDALVRLVLVAALPRHAVVAPQAEVVRARLDRAPA